MAVDPQAQRLLDLIASVQPAELPTRTAESARVSYATLLTPPAPVDKTGVVSTQDTTIPGPAGKLPVRVYRPGLDGPRATVVYFHGGGWTIGSVDTHDPQARLVCEQVGAVVVSVDYRLAPEHPFPAPLDDCIAATRWAHEHVEELGGRADRVAVAGPSAGGNLAAAVAIRLRDAGGPPICAQLLVYPVTDASRSTPSYAENASGYLLDADTMAWFFECYLDGRDATADVSVLDAPDHRDLPPAVIATAGYDPLRDEGAAYAARLRAAGVSVTLLEFPHLIHEFMGLTGYVEAAAAAVAEVLDAFRSLLVDAPRPKGLQPSG